MKTYTITTLGCKVNQSESDAIARQLRAAGWVPASCEGTADICIVNTCAVTGKASMQSRQAARHAIRSNPDARIVVTGCYVEIEPRVFRSMDGVDDIIGSNGKEALASRIPTAWDGHTGPGSGICSGRNDPTDLPGRRLPGGRSRPFLKIQDGCNAHCTYCIVPYARGRSRSITVESALEGIRQMELEGYREVVLTGVHLGCYGMDLSPATSLYQLLARIRSARFAPRIRLSSIEPVELTEEVMRLVSASASFCRHFHIPLQSGDDRILDRMNRPYDAGFFRELIGSVRDRMPDAAIGTDILVGFPGETESAFEETYMLIDSLPITYLHVFPFSSREGTPASRYPDQIGPAVIKERSKRMRILGDEKKRAFYQEFLGSRAEIIVEGGNTAPDGFLKGMTSNYIPVLVPTGGCAGLGDDLRDKMVAVRIYGVEDRSVFGKIA